MAETDIARLKSDATGNTALSDTLKEAVKGFKSTDDALEFLASRGFEVTATELKESAQEDASPEIPSPDEPESGYGALMGFMRSH